jgi:two-component system invasion response regulator UvrY
MEKKINIYLVEHVQYDRLALRRILDDIHHVQVLGEAGNNENAIRKLKQTNADIVVMDLEVAGIGTLEAVRRLQKYLPTLKIIIISGYEDDLFPARIIRAGALGYLSKRCSVDDLETAIDYVAAGRRYVSSDVAHYLASRSDKRNPNSSALELLSDRELQIMLLFVQGGTIRDISEQLYLSPKTIRTYRYKIFDKLGVRSDVALAQIAHRHRIAGFDAHEFYLKSA